MAFGIFGSCQVALVQRLPIGTVKQQHPYGFLVVVNGSNHERRSAIFVLHLQVGPAANEQVDQAGIASPRRMQQSGFTVGIHFVYSGTVR